MGADQIGTPSAHEETGSVPPIRGRATVTEETASHLPHSKQRFRTEAWRAHRGNQCAMLRIARRGSSVSIGTTFYPLAGGGLPVTAGARTVVHHSDSGQRMISATVSRAPKPNPDFNEVRAPSRRGQYRVAEASVAGLYAERGRDAADRGRGPSIVSGCASRRRTYARYDAERVVAHRARCDSELQGP